MNLSILLTILLLLFANTSGASYTPLSGTYSNVTNKDTGGYTTTMKNKINLVVTVNENGQQFFIQCFKAEKAGFGVATIFKTPQQTAKIKAGPECPAADIQIELDYEGAVFRVGNGWGYLPRGDIYVPIED